LQFTAHAAQAPEHYEIAVMEGPETLLHLKGTDLLIVAGLYWTGSPTVKWTTPVPYRTPTECEKEALRLYIQGGGAVLGFHGGIASFDDWPEFSQLIGYGWNWAITTHGPVQDYRVYAAGATPWLGWTHAVDTASSAGPAEFTLCDENYFNIQLNPGVQYQTHLKMDCGAVQLPMLLSCNGNHFPGAGRSAYLALGHDERAHSHPMFQATLWDTIGWLLGERPD
jgi:type 1 glutamine amidotransferase